MFDLILIRFGELSLKGKNKINFINSLAKNISHICNIKHNEIKIKIDRIFVPYSEENIKNLNYVFGISSFSPVIKSKTSLQDIENTLLKNIDNKYKTFKISSRRNWKDFELNSIEINNYFGDFIINNFKWKVDVKSPDIVINIEIHNEYSYIFWEKFEGLGGLPVGTSGTSLHLLSGGIDSPVAALEMMKRGVKVDFLSFISPPHTDEKTIEKINMIVEHLNKYQINSTLYLFNYTDLMNYIGLTSKQAYKILLMRRSFYRIASIIAKKNNYLGISNGENLGQVASQTMEAMKVIHNSSDLPIYQPLLTNDKIETIAKAQKFKTFEISIIKACETCELFAPNNPKTKPILSKVKELEEELPLINSLEENGLQKNITIKKYKKSN